MWWPWNFLLKRSNGDDGDSRNKPECFPAEYKQHGMKEKGSRAQQLHRHDSQSKLCLDDIDEQIRKLKTIKSKIKTRNGKVRRGCEEKEG